MIGDVRKKQSHNLSDVISELETLSNSTRSTERFTEKAVSRTNASDNYSSSTLSVPPANIVATQSSSYHTENISSNLQSDFNPYLPIEIPDDRNDEVTMIDTTQALLNVSSMINLNTINHYSSESGSNALDDSKISNSVTVKKNV